VKAAGPSPSSFGPGALASSPGPDSAVAWMDAGSAAIEAGVAQRHADGSVVFSAPDPDEASVETDDVVQRAGAGPAASTSTSTPAAGGARGTDGSDLDELAKRLYGRLRVMLKHELRLDRERAGILTQGRR